MTGGGHRAGAPACSARPARPPAPYTYIYIYMYTSFIYIYIYIHFHYILMSYMAYFSILAVRGPCAPGARCNFRAPCADGGQRLSEYAIMQVFSRVIVHGLSETHHVLTNLMCCATNLGRLSWPMSVCNAAKLPKHGAFLTHQERSHAKTPRKTHILISPLCMFGTATVNVVFAAGNIQ